MAGRLDPLLRQGASPRGQRHSRNVRYRRCEKRLRGCVQRSRLRNPCGRLLVRSHLRPSRLYLDHSAAAANLACFTLPPSSNVSPRMGLPFMNATTCFRHSSAASPFVGNTFGLSPASMTGVGWLSRITRSLPRTRTRRGFDEDMRCICSCSVSRRYDVRGNHHAATWISSKDQ